MQVDKASNLQYEYSIPRKYNMGNQARFTLDPERF